MYTLTPGSNVLAAPVVGRKFIEGLEAQWNTLRGLHSHLGHANI